MCKKIYAVPIMGSVLYYSEQCPASQRILKFARDNRLDGAIHFVCVDQREHAKGSLYAVLQGGVRMVIPPCVTCTPTLINLVNYSILFGDDVVKHIATNAASMQPLPTPRFVENTRDFRRDGMRAPASATCGSLAATSLFTRRDVNSCNFSNPWHAPQMAPTPEHELDDRGRIVRKQVNLDELMAERARDVPTCITRV